MQMAYGENQWGRWMTPDLLGGDIANPQSLNRYAYALNNPTTLTDPSGLGPCPSINGMPTICITSNADGDGNTPPGLGGGIGECPSFGCTPNCSIFTCGPMPGQPGGGGGGRGGAPAPKPAPPANVPAAANNPCGSALAAANRTPGGVARANAAWNVLQTSATAHNIATALLAAIGVRETDFRNIQESNGGPGMGVFQLTNQQGVSTAQAFNLSFAANYAANMLSSNINYLSNAFSFTPSQLLQATAASYNLGKFGISGNPNTIDVGTTGGNYGSTVVNLMGCFSHP